MLVQPNPMTVSDYVEAVIGRNIRINRDYQRGGGIWPSSAKSALIETMILGYPMPALFLHQRFDKETRKPFRELVDGQQRTDAIVAYWNNKMRLSTALPTEELRGKRLRALDEDQYEAFLTYSLPIFLFTDATESDVREAFRRINSHTSVLNGEEKRHSRFQGPMKWFVVALSKELQSSLSDWGVFTRRQLIRMRDAWLVSEVVYALEHGLRTTKASHLDDLYHAYDPEDSFPQADAYRHQILRAFRVIAGWQWLPSTPFTKPYQFLMVLLAVMHSQEVVPSLGDLVPGGTGLLPPAEIEAGMGELVRALDSSDEITAYLDKVSEIEAEGEPTERVKNKQLDFDRRLLRHADFIRATSGKTNTEESRRIRFVSFYSSLAHEKIE